MEREKWNLGNRWGWQVHRAGSLQSRNHKCHLLRKTKPNKDPEAEENRRTGFSPQSCQDWSWNHVNTGMPPRVLEQIAEKYHCVPAYPSGGSTRRRVSPGHEEEESQKTETVKGRGQCRERRRCPCQPADSTPSFSLPDGPGGAEGFDASLLFICNSK